LVPREHGAWGVLYGAFLAGVVVAGRLSVPVFLLLVTITALAFLNGPLTILARRSSAPLSSSDLARLARWLLAWGLLAAAAGLPLLLVYDMAFLLLFGLVGLGCLSVRLFVVRRQADRTLWGELVGTAGLALAGPAAHAVAIAGLRSAAWLLWVLLILFFASGIFYVRMQIRSLAAARRGTEDATPVRTACIAYHLLLLGIVPTLAAIGAVSWWALLAFAPALTRAAVGLRRLSAPLNVRRLGWSEVALTAAFVLSLVLVF
jgi:hypothetical protein